MKNTRTLINGLVACGVALAMVSTLAAQTVTQGTAKVIRIKGPARYTLGDNTWKPLNVGDVLKAGAVVQTSTEKDSYVDLLLGEGQAPAATTPVYKPSIPSSQAPTIIGGESASDQNVVRIFENSALGIDKFTTQQTGAEMVQDLQLDLKAGRLLGSVKKLSAASKYEIKLPNGVAGIRGTIVDVHASGIVRVLVGSAVYAFVGANGQPQTQVITAGHQCDAATGGAITQILPGILQSLEQLCKHLPPGGPPGPIHRGGDGGHNIEHPPTPITPHSSGGGSSGASVGSVTVSTGT